MTDHQKLLCALLSAEDDSNNPSTTPTPLEVMTLLSDAGADHGCSPPNRPLAISRARALQHSGVR